MEISYGLLVALMFITILVLGIAGILTSIAAIVARPERPSRIHTSWKALLLLAHFNFFWHTLEILSVQDWGFSGFLYVMLGPILLFFATSVLLSRDGEEDADASYFGVATRFFRLMVLVQLWTIGADLVLGRGFTGSGALNVAMIILVLALAGSHNRRLHLAGSAIAWLLLGSGAVMRGLGVIV